MKFSKIHIETDLSPSQKDELSLAEEDIRQVEPSIDISDTELVLGDNPDDVIGSCGEYKPPNQPDNWTDEPSCWIIPDKCAGRGYSDYRWRVNRTLQGVTIHELGHHVERQLTKNTETTISQLRETFEPEDDITNYSDKNYTENFAESWRVYVTNPLLLKCINEEKYSFFDGYFHHNRAENTTFLQNSVEDFHGIVKNQLRSASTNEHIRQSMSELGVSYT